MEAAVPGQLTDDHVLADLGLAGDFLVLGPGADGAIYLLPLVLGERINVLDNITVTVVYRADPLVDVSMVFLLFVKVRDKLRETKIHHEGWGFHTPHMV